MVCDFLKLAFLSGSAREMWTESRYVSKDVWVVIVDKKIFSHIILNNNE